MAKYLIDANLPYYFNLWNSADYIHQFDLKPDAADSDIWEFSKLNNLTIVTKDADFSDRIMLSTPPPRVVHVRVGNMKFSDFHRFITEIWPEIEKLARENKLINIYKDRIETIE